MNDMWSDAKQNVKEKSPITDSKISKTNIEKYLYGGDVVLSEFSFAGTGALLLCIDGLVNESGVGENILNQFYTADAFKHCKTQKDAVNLMKKGFKTHPSTSQVYTLKDLINGVLSANFAIVFEEENTAFLFDIKGFEKRSIESPSDSEGALKSSKDSFTEPLRVNTAIVRRHIRSHNLQIKQLEIGDISSCTVAMVYMRNIADPKITERIEKLLRGIKAVGIVSVGQIEDALTGSGFSIFPKIVSTEKADKFCANVIDGKVGIIIDGYPVTLIAPACLAMFFQTPDDYAYHYVLSSAVRLIRYACMLVSILLPSVYLAVVSTHAEILPPRLAQSIISAKVGVPFSAFFEIFFMLIAFEVLIEAGLRLPQGMGQTISIVAGLVVGDSAISARLVSPAVVMVMAIAGITSFAIPYQDLVNPVRFVRLAFIFFAQLFSLIGIVFCGIGLLIYLNSIESFGMSYLTPFSLSPVKSWFKDTFVKGRYEDEKV